MTGESHTQAQVTRRFDVAPKQVFDAWLNPEQMCKFLFTSDPSLSFSQGQDVQNDPRVGGTYRVMDRRDGKEYVADGDAPRLAPGSNGKDRSPYASGD